MSYDSVAKHKLLIKFIASCLCKIISSCIKEHSIYMDLSVFFIKRLTGTKLAVKLLKAPFIIKALAVFLKEAVI